MKDFKKLLIGKSNKFYNLWSLEFKNDFKDVNGINVPFLDVRYRFIKKLSKDLQEARKKALMEGCTMLVPYPDLKKLNRKDVIKFGKNKGKSVREINDDEFLFWYYIETLNPVAEKILIKSFGYKKYKGQLIRETITIN